MNESPASSRLDCERENVRACRSSLAGDAASAAATAIAARADAAVRPAQRPIIHDVRDCVRAP